MVVLEKENCLREYKYWSYEKGKDNLVFIVVRYIEFFNIWLISNGIIKNELPVKNLSNIKRNH